MKIEVQPRSSMLILYAENDAEMSQLARIENDIGHGIVHKEPIKFKAGIGRQWGTHCIEFPLIVEEKK